MHNWHWEKFVKATKNRKPINYLIEAVKILNSQKGKALDIGCGAGIDSKYLAENGFKVEAIDLNKTSVEETKKICEGLAVNAILKNVNDYVITPNNFDLIIAWNTLSFLGKEEAERILLDIKNGLKENGLFVFSVFGPKDDWAKNHSEMSFWTKEELKNTLSGMDFIKFSEEKQKKPGATGNIKFWHLIQGITRKK